MENILYKNKIYNILELGSMSQLNSKFRQNIKFQTFITNSSLLNYSEFLNLNYSCEFTRSNPVNTITFRNNSLIIKDFDYCVSITLENDHTKTQLVVSKI